MNIKRGTYPGASQFAHFERDIYEMNLDECRDLLECILQRAMPGETSADFVFRELAIAEEAWREGRP